MSEIHTNWSVNQHIRKGNIEEAELLLKSYSYNELIDTISFSKMMLMSKNFKKFRIGYKYNHLKGDKFDAKAFLEKKIELADKIILSNF